MKRTKICVSIYGRDRLEIGQLIPKALANGADLVEIRLDMSDENSWDKLYSILKPYHDKLILTLRTVDGMGHSTMPNSDRLSVLEKIGEIGPAYIDVELKTAKNIGVKRLGKQGHRLIVSWHSDSTPTIEELVKTAQDCLQYGIIAKIVTLSRGVEDNFKILMLYTYLPAERLVAFCMGEKGWITRILSMAAGAPIAYASLDELTTTPGQLSLKEMIAIRNRICGGVTMK